MKNKNNFNLSRFRINFVPKETTVRVSNEKGFRIIKYFINIDKIKSSEFYFDFLKNAVLSIPNIILDIEHQRYNQVNDTYYYKLKTHCGEIYFEINNGGKYPNSEQSPPTLSIETNPYIPTTEFLKEIKKVVRLLIEKTRFKIFFWDAGRFVTVDELYGREGPTKK